MMGDGLHEMGLAQSGVSPDVQGVVCLAGHFGDGQSGGESQLIVGSLNEVVKGIFDVQSGFFCQFDVQLFFFQFFGCLLGIGPLIVDFEIQFAVSDLFETLQDILTVAGFYDLASDGGDAFKDQNIIVDRDGFKGLEPSVIGNICQFGLDQGDHLVKDLLKIQIRSLRRSIGNVLHSLPPLINASYYDSKSKGGIQ